MGPALPHDGLRQRSRRVARAETSHRARLRLPRAETGVLVLRLRLVTGRIRDRIRRQGQPDAGRRLSLRRAAEAGGSLRSGPHRRRRLCRHLDNDGLDHPCQPGAEPEPGAGIRAGRHTARAAGAGGFAGRIVPAALRARGLGAGHHVGRETGRHPLSPPAGPRAHRLRPPEPGLPGRLRHRR